MRAYDAALKKIAAGIRQAIADQRKWRDRDLQLAKDWKTVSAMPISDCTDPNLTPAGTLGGAQLQGIGGVAPNLKPVEIPTVPTKGLRQKRQGRNCRQIIYGIEQCVAQ